MCKVIGKKTRTLNGEYGGGMKFASLLKAASMIKSAGDVIGIRRDLFWYGAGNQQMTKLQLGSWWK